MGKSILLSRKSIISKTQKSLLIFGSLMLFVFSSVVFGQITQVTILSGSKETTQYRYIKDIVNIVGPTVDFKIVNKESNGSADNFDQLIDPKSPIKVAYVQSDFLYYMQAQDKRLNTEKTKNLKVIVPMGYEQIHLVTKASKGYKGLKEMDNKTVAIGSAGQGTYRTAQLIKERTEVWWKADNTMFDDCFGALHLDKIDAFFIVGSAPIPRLDVNPQSMVDQLALVPLEDFKDWAKYYKPDTIHKGEYKWLTKDVPTFSVHTVLVVNEAKLKNMEERNEIMKLRAGIKGKYEQLKKGGHPNWKEIDLADWKDSDWPLFAQEHLH